MTDSINPEEDSTEKSASEKETKSLWLSYALAVFGLIAIIFAFSTFGNPRRESQLGLDDVYDGDRQVKVYLFERYLDTKHIDIPAKTGKTSDLATALSIYTRSDLKTNPLAIRRAGVLTDQLHKTGSLDIFSRLTSKDVTSDYPPRDVADLRNEAMMWREIYSTPKLSPKDAARCASEIENLNLGPTRVFALEKVYTQAGLKNEARKVVSSAEESAAASVVGLALLIMTLCAAGFAGVILIGLFLSHWRRHIPDPGKNPLEQPDESAKTVPSSALFGGFIMYLTISLFLGLIAALLLRPELENLKYQVRLMRLVELQFGLSLVSGLLAFYALKIRLKDHGFRLSDIGLSTRDLGKDVLWGLAGYCAVLPLLLGTTLLWNALIKWLFPSVKTPPNPVEPWMMSGNGLVIFLVFLMVTVLAPIFEELFFRGALYGALRERLGVKVAIPLSAAAFAIMHPFPDSFLPIMAIGCVFAVLYETRKSLIPSMVAHALNNGVMFIAMYLLAMK